MKGWNDMTHWQRFKTILNMPSVGYHSARDSVLGQGQYAPPAPASGGGETPPPSYTPVTSFDQLRQWNELQAQKQMDFQKDMSNTAYQRAVSDMRSAGLNPAVMFSQGGSAAETPSGSQAHNVSSIDAYWLAELLVGSLSNLGKGFLR